MIEPIKNHGANKALAVCDTIGCNFQETIPCGYKGGYIKGGGRLLDMGSARKNIRAGGWSVLKTKVYCPTCTAINKQPAKRKEVPMKAVSEKAVEQPRVPTRAQKREIMDMLETAYDVSAERYTGGDTDDTVADVLKVMPGWVAQIREEFFGPDGGNEDIEKLSTDIDAFLKSSNEIAKEASTAVEKLVAARREAQGMQQKLDAIKKAVGSRVIKKAGA
jgi:hypothetical protein